MLADHEIAFYNYSQEELEDVAVSIGIDPEFERHLFWIAAQELLAPPPPPWKAFAPDDVDDDAIFLGVDEIGFVNMDTGELTDKRPVLESARNQVIAERANVSFTRLTLSGNLDIHKGEDFVVSTTTMGGEKLAQVTIHDPEAMTVNELLLIVRKQAREHLTISVPKFYLGDAIVLSHSHMERTVSDMFSTLLSVDGNTSSVSCVTN